MEACIWNRQTQEVKFLGGKPDSSATYEQMISAGWKPKMEGEITIVFEKSACNPETEVHTETN